MGKWKFEEQDKVVAGRQAAFIFIIAHFMRSTAQ